MNQADLPFDFEKIMKQYDSEIILKLSEYLWWYKRDFICQIDMFETKEGHTVRFVRTFT